MQLGIGSTPGWEEIPRTEGFFFEINQALSMAIMALGVVAADNKDHRFLIKYIKRIKALVKPSGIFNEIRPQDKAMYGDREKFIELAIFTRCDDIINLVEKAKATGNLDLKKVMMHISSLVYIINEYYMYSKTKVSFAGTYPPAFEIYDKEGIE